MPLNLGDVEIIIDPPASGTPTLIVSGPRGPKGDKGDKGDTGDAGSGGGLPDPDFGEWMTITPEELIDGNVHYDGYESYADVILDPDAETAPGLRAGPGLTGETMDLYINLGNRLDTKNKTYEVAVLMTWDAYNWVRSDPSIWTYSQQAGDQLTAYNESNWWELGGKSLPTSGYVYPVDEERFWYQTLVTVGQGVDQWWLMEESDPAEPNLLMEIWGPASMVIYGIKYRETTLIPKVASNGGMHLGYGSTVHGRSILTAPFVYRSSGPFRPRLPYLSMGSYGWEVQAVPAPAADSQDKFLKIGGTNHQISWDDPPAGQGGGGAVSSVDGRSGDVSLSDLYAPIGSSQAAPTYIQASAYRAPESPLLLTYPSTRITYPTILNRLMEIDGSPGTYKLTEYALGNESRIAMLGVSGSVTLDMTELTAGYVQVEIAYGELYAISHEWRPGDQPKWSFNFTVAVRPLHILQVDSVMSFENEASNINVLEAGLQMTGAFL